MRDNLRRHTVNEPLATLAEKDDEIAKLRAEVSDLLPMLDADAMTISTLQGVIDRLRAGIRVALGDARCPRQYPGGFKASEGYCEHGRRFDMPCDKCLRAHLLALLGEPGPEDRT